ncbi:M50 family metallopeptidase [Marilutibacter maris]|uniref:Peptidase M50 domain-containing protein n=1 Tax=Marilutibacter maris TaxID=1605891 RepID=A0A2U9T8J2_9GAMM|nr:M50 family metallopeptidase [Lysobacter maris]AWV05809.1 hypothetical protein C9I47_0083 [Lysobacter maris]KAB8198563.1 hypothetical protein FKV24_001440 [Lysobacter maris]
MTGDTDAHAAFLPPAAPDTGRGGRPGKLGFPASLLLWILVGGLVGMLSGRMGIGPSAWIADWAPTASVPLALLFALLTIWPNIIVHEAGHALCGIARGMHAMAFGIGPLRLERGEHRWRFRRGAWLRGIGGFAALLPKGRRGLSRFDQACFFVGGPLANLATGVLALALLTSWTAPPAIASLLLGTALSALFFGALNLLPFQTQGWQSDGRQLLDLARHSPDAVVRQRLRQLMALTLAGVRPREWPEALMPVPADDTSPGLAVNAQILRLSRAMDRNDAVAAADAARRTAAGLHDLPVSVRPHLAVTMAGYAALMLRDPVVLAAWRPLCEGGLFDLSAFRDWLDAESAALAGDAATARDRISAARAGLERLPDPVSVLQMRESLDALQARLAAA